jgi:isocitrate lyase
MPEWRYAAVQRATITGEMLRKTLDRERGSGSARPDRAEEQALARAWRADERWHGVARPYGPAEVLRFRGSLKIEHTLARVGAERLWWLLHTEPYVAALGACDADQAVQMVRAGLPAIWLPGGQDSVGRVNAALRRADELQSIEGRGGVHWLAPVAVDAGDMGGAAADAYETTRQLIEAGAAGLLLDDRCAVAPAQFVGRLVAARLAADVCGVPALLIARTSCGRLDAAIARGLAYAAFADLVSFVPARPDLEQARRFAAAVRAEHPGKLLAYECPSSFQWSRNIDPGTIARYQRELGAMGYRFQLVADAGARCRDLAMFELARRYASAGMTAYAEFQERELLAEETSG